MNCFGPGSSFLMHSRATSRFARAARSTLSLGILLAAQAAFGVGLLDTKVTAGAETVLQNTGATVRLEQPQLDAYGGAVFYVPEPMALWQIQSGVALLSLLFARRRRV